ncbi:MAG TPA: hypothetical protein VKN18_11560 [Blastocatellia bacterium]|nr:hypothetical protein [Blastocatellia bacterium]
MRDYLRGHTIPAPSFINGKSLTFDSSNSERVDIPYLGSLIQDHFYARIVAFVNDIASTLVGDIGAQNPESDFLYR